LFVKSFVGFTIIAILAHILVWQWRPWIPGPKGYAMLDGAHAALHGLLPFVS
jgi:light-harvesting complex 1 beta chain